MKKIKEIIRKVLSATGVRTVITSVISGVISGAIILLLSPFVSDRIESRIKYNAEVTSLEKIYLGESREYIKSELGQPVIEFLDDNKLLVAYYNMPNTTVCCTYDNDEVVAFMIIMRTNKKMYQINRIEGKRFYLGNMTYAEYDENQGKSSVAIPANNDDFLHYSETFYGARPAVYNYILLGNYKCFSNQKAVDLAFAERDSDEEKVKQLRKIVKPNVYGMIMLGYEDCINLLPETENFQVYAEAVFNRGY